MGGPTVAGSHVWCMALQTFPLALFIAVSSHPSGRWIVWVPLRRQLGVSCHRLAWAEGPDALTGWADYVASPSGQVLCPGLPFMFSPTPMLAAWTL